MNKHKIRMVPAACLLSALAAGLAAPPALAQGAAGNREIIGDFVRLVYEKKQARAGYEAYVAPDLIQHNRNVADGREAAIRELEGLFRDPASHFEVRHVIVDGDLASVHFRGTLGAGGDSAAVMELFRLSQGKIVEHWDVFQMAAREGAKNAHPDF
jgi:predicted SnoaL-like aldol condensation-catalyzing enzyme